MKNLLLIALATLTLSSTTFAQDKAPPKAGDSFIDIKVKNEKNEDVKLSSIIKGKVAVIDFWSTHCGICLHEAPYEITMVKQYQDNKELKDKVIFVMIAIDDIRDEWLNGISKYWNSTGNHFNSPGYWDSEAKKAYGFDHIPTIVIVNKEGKIVTMEAEHPSTGELDGQIKNAL